MAAAGLREIGCDVGTLVDADVWTIDALARLQLEAKRSGYRLRFCNVPWELCELLRFAGLAEVLVVEPRGEAEEREERLGVEEEGELGDAAV